MKTSVADSSNPIRIVIVDDHQLFLEGVEYNLSTQADLKVVGKCADGDVALELVRDLQPDVVIMDINMPHMNGIEVTRQLVTEHVPVRIIMLTAYDDIKQVIHAMRAGASAYCAKEIHPDHLFEVIRHVQHGQFVINTQVYDEDGLRDWLDKSVGTAGQYFAELDDSFSPLSPREMEILRYVTKGLSNKEIAKALQISHQTVKNHMTAILRKLAVGDRTQAAVFALKHGWVRLTDAADHVSGFED